LKSGFSGVDDQFLASVGHALTVINFKRFYGLVAAFRARNG